MLVRGGRGCAFRRGRSPSGGRIRGWFSGEVEAWLGWWCAGGFAGMVESFCCRNLQSPPKSLIGSACKRGNMGLRPQMGEDTRPAEKSNSLSSIQPRNTRWNSKNIDTHRWRIIKNTEINKNRCIQGCKHPDIESQRSAAEAVTCKSAAPCFAWSWRAE